MEYGYLKIMNEHLAHLHYNRALIKGLKDFANAFVSKNEDHINFFGSNFTGVYSIYFTTLDKNALFIDVLGNVNDGKIRKEIRELPSVGATWVVATEPVTVVCMYLIHMFMRSNLTEREIKEACLACGRIIHYKFLSSLTNYYFPYNVKEELALAAYTALSRKYTLKQEGTWYKTIDKRIEDLLYTQTTWHEEIMAYGPDENLVKMFGDMQYRMRSMIKNIAEVTYRLHDEGVGVDSGTIQIQTDDGLKIMDVTRLQGGYEQYILGIIPEPRALIKAELVTIIGNAITTMPEPPLYEVLLDMSKRSLAADKKIDKFVRDIMIYVFTYLHEEGKGDAALSNLTQLIEKLKALLTASKTTNPTVLNLRKEADAIVKKGCKTRSASALSGLRTGLILYIIIRTFTKNHYE